MGNNLLMNNAVADVIAEMVQIIESKTGKEIESIEPSRAACDDGTIAVRFFKKATQDSHAPST